ncbi:hypothetical protein [Tepidibacillus marianensis]|uniref:hypothetical protein n=1 Tax=Tepidibacillus marianensis TaxID=3131995 RepID=UPI0030CAECB4
MTIFLFFILPILFFVGLSYGTAYLILLIDRSIEKDLLNEMNEVQEGNEVQEMNEAKEMEKVTLSL